MTAHKHAAAMLQYAQDAAKTDKPWLRWEIGSKAENKWWDVASEGPAWNPSVQYRRKPDQAKTETRTYECWDCQGELRWFAPKVLRLPELWKRVPSEDKIVEVVL